MYHNSDISPPLSTLTIYPVFQPPKRGPPKEDDDQEKVVIVHHSSTMSNLCEYIVI